MASDITEAVLHKHPDFVRWEKIYKFFEESYTGGHEYISGGHLFKHTFEDNEGHKDRLERAYYYNYCAPVVNTYNSFIYGQDVDRDYGSLADNPLFEMFLKNADKQGNGYEEVCRTGSKWASATGIQFWLIDKPAVPAATRKEEIDNELYPYIVRLSPRCVLDWGLDTYGNPVWIKVKEGAEDRQTFDAKEQKVERYRIWYRDRWELYEVTKSDTGSGKAVKVDEGEHPVGEVPIVPVVHVSECPMSGISLIEDIAYVNRAIYNWCSLLDEILYRQTFSQLVMPEDPKSPISDQALGTARGLGFPPEARHAPHFISPDASQAAVISEQIKDGVEEIYRLASLEGGSGVEKDASGISKAYDFTLTNNTLVSKAINMEDAETRALRIWAKWLEIDDPGVNIAYAREYDIIKLSEELENAIKAKTMNISQTFDKEMKKRVVHRMLPRLADDMKKQIEQEIDSASAEAPKGPFDNQTNQIFGNTGTEGGE